MLRLGTLVLKILFTEDRNHTALSSEELPLSPNRAKLSISSREWRSNTSAGADCYSLCDDGDGDGLSDGLNVITVDRMSGTLVLKPEQQRDRRPSATAKRNPTGSSSRLFQAPYWLLLFVTDCSVVWFCAVKVIFKNIMRCFSNFLIF